MPQFCRLISIPPHRSGNRPGGRNNSMYRWKRLDLRSKDSAPRAGDLVALRMTPSNGGATFYNRERYEIGHFKADERCGKKVWWYSNSGSSDPVKLKQHYDIWWCPVTPYDGI